MDRGLNHWQTNRRDKFGAAETCDLSAHTVVQECKAGQEKEGGIVESVWNRDVLLHQQVVTDVANCWKEFAKQHVISSGTVEKVVQLIAVIVPAIVHTSSLVFLLVLRVASSCFVCECLSPSSRLLQA